MRLLLDTHAMYWYVEGDPRLSAAARKTSTAKRADWLFFCENLSIGCKRPTPSRKYTGSKLPVAPRERRPNNVLVPVRSTEFREKVLDARKCPAKMSAHAENTAY